MLLYLRLTMLIVVVLFGVALVGCGGYPGDEVELGAPTTTSRAERERLRIAALRRELDALRNRRRRHHAAQGRQGVGQLLDGSDVASFKQLASGLGGQVGVTVGRAGDPNAQQLGSLTTGKAWSSIKVPIATKVLSDAGGPGGLSSTDRELIRRALTASDNAAAAKLFEGMKARYGGVAGAAEAAGEPLRQAGDEDTTVSTQGRAGFSPYGQTEWSLVQQHRFMARLAGGCLQDSASSRYVLQLMNQVVPDQRWGLGSAGVPAQFKGGWGPGADGRYLVRQMGVLELDNGRHPMVATIASMPSDGQLGTGQNMLSQLAKWLVEHINHARVTPVGC
jgi:hypothetical protein